MYSIATLANTNSLDDLKIFLNTLQLFNNILPDVYLYCDTYIDIINLENSQIVAVVSMSQEISIEKINEIQSDNKNLYRLLQLFIWQI